MKKHFCLLFYLIFFLYNYSLIAQARVEIQVSSLSDDYYILPVGDAGMLLFGESDKKQKNLTLYDFTKYDINFTKEWVLNIKIPDNLTLKKQYYDEQKNKLYLLMAKSRGAYYTSEFQILELDVNTKNTQTLSGVFPGKVYITDFVALNGFVYFGGHQLPPSYDAFLKQTYSLLLLYIPTFFGSMNYKLKPVLHIANFNDKKSATFPFKLKGNTKISSISLDKTINEVNVFLNHKESKKDINYSMLKFNNTGVHTESIDLALNENTDITSGKCLSLNNNEQIIIGTYNFRSKNLKESYLTSSPSSTASVGMYYAKIINGKQEFFKTYPFSKFSNFYNYLTFRGQNRIKKKIAKKKEKGKEINYQYNLLINNLIKKDNEYVMLAEAYYPEYETRCETVFNPNGTTYQRCYSVFIGYRFTHAILAGFDKDGNLVWDNSFEIMDILTYDLKPKVKYLLEDNEILLVYSFNGELKSKVVSGNTVVEGKTSIKIDTGKKDDKVKDNYGSGIEYWYGNYFIAYGYQKIKQDKTFGNTKRRVFYFNKFAYM